MRTPLLVLVALLLAASASADTFYVAKTGTAPSASDANSCTTAKTITTPKLTIGSGVTCLSPGDTLLVRVGTYAEALLYSIPSGSSWSSPVRLANYNGETVTMAPTSGERVLAFAGFGGGGGSGTQQYIDIDGIDLDATAGVTHEVIKIECGTGYAADHIRIQNLDMHMGTQKQNAVIMTSLIPGCVGNNEWLNVTLHGGPTPIVGDDFESMFYVQSPDNVFDGLDIYDGNGSGIQIYNGNPGAMPDRTIVRNTKIHDFTRTTGHRAYGIIAARGTGHQLYNNVIYNIGPTGGSTGGIYLFNTSSVEVYNNTLYNNAAGGIRIETGLTGMIIRNNIAYSNAGQGNYVDLGSGTTENHDLFGTNPSFVNTGTGDFQLQSGSAAIDQGATLTLFTVDLLGASRSGTWDIGAYEFDAEVEEATISASPSTVAVLATTTVTWSGIPTPSATDWIALYAAGTFASSPGSYVAWVYVSCSQTAGSPAASGSCAFAVPSVSLGTYELWLLANDSVTPVTPMATTNLQVVAAPTTCTACRLRFHR